jgi:hypothetical protein
VGRAITYVKHVSWESPNGKSNLSVSLAFFVGVHATVLQHLLVLKGDAEIDVDTEMLYQSINIFEFFRMVFYARRISTMALYFYSWLISERTPVDTSDK